MPKENIDTSSEKKEQELIEKSALLVKSVQDFIKDHNTISLGDGSVITIKNNHICLTKCAKEKYQENETIMEFIINDGIVEIKEDNQTYKDLVYVESIWEEFKRQVFLKTNGDLQRTKERLFEFFNSADMNLQ